MHEDLKKALTEGAAERVEAKALREEQSIDKVARGFAHRYDVSWVDMTPDQRDAWRMRTAELLAYVDSTAFQGLLPGVADHR